MPRVMDLYLVDQSPWAHCTPHPVCVCVRKWTMGLRNFFPPHALIPGLFIPMWVTSSRPLLFLYFLLLIKRFQFKIHFLLH